MATIDIALPDDLMQALTPPACLRSAAAAARIDAELTLPIGGGAAGHGRFHPRHSDRLLDELQPDAAARADDGEHGVPVEDPEFISTVGCCSQASSTQSRSRVS